MSEPRIISPLLDGFALGDSMSSHSGVNCYPAMRADSDERYIVKTISIPASQTQLEALLLTGAYPNAEAARNYFKELTRGIRSEVELLEKLAAQRGFLPFLGYQIAPLADGVGFEFYLISPYRRSLGRFLQRSPMTHLSAVNMGIDLCAALSVCREAGYLYVDLKPSNIYLTGEQQFHIGDLGFISLDSLKFASLPDRCRSNWIPPEIADAYATLNTTMDTYALGLVLYQVYNNGLLPFDSEQSRQELMNRLAAGEPLPAPAYADYEMAQIILKACAYDPADRWQDPAQMGHALIAYMQRNGANDVPIGPPVVTEPELTIQPPSEELLSDENLPDESEAAETSDAFEEDAALSESDGLASDADESDTQTPEDEPAEESDWIDRMDQLLNENDADSDSADDESLTLRQILTNEDTMTDDIDVEQVDAETLSDEVAGILNQADELISHEAPQPAVAPEPIDIPIPEPIVLEPEITEDDLAPEVSLSDETPDEEELPELDDDLDLDEPELRPKRGRAILGWIVTIIILGLLCACCHLSYTKYYLQEIESLSVTGDADTMTVSVVSGIDQNLLTVVCVDQYGAKQTSALMNGTATFPNLTPDNQYNITLEVKGLHKLTGNTTAQYYTLPQTSVSTFSAITGPDDGSVILSFTTEGPEVTEWTVQYTADGQPTDSLSFTGNMITLSNLNPGSVYTFTLIAGDDVDLVGQTQITHTASKVICAENLAVTGQQDDTITASWTAPEGVQVESWTARCYSENGYDQTLTVNETTATFTGVADDAAHTVEITAAGMTQSTRTYVTANPITITAVNTENMNSESLTVAWEYEGNAPAGGWLLLYTVNQGSEQHVIQCEDPVAVIDPVVPGFRYDLTIQTADSSTVFGGTGTAELPEAKPFDQLGLNAADVKAVLCKAPDKDNWTYLDVAQDDRTSAFAADDTAGILLSTADKYSIENKNVSILYVFRDSEGALATICSDSAGWERMWTKGHCDLEIPQLPANAGDYTLDLYIGGQLMATLELTIQ